MEQVLALKRIDDTHIALAMDVTTFAMLMATVNSYGEEHFTDDDNGGVFALGFIATVEKIFTAAGV